MDAAGVHFRECHVRRTDLQRHHEISKCGKGQGHDSEKDHDRAVHCSQRIIKVRSHFAVRYCAGPENKGEKLADYWNGLTGISQLPPHQHHQGKAQKQERESTETVLDPDDLMVCGENIFSPKPELVVLVFASV